ncbi:peptidase U32 family protein [Fulvivirga marina]|uniref:peptidase U32 family protein n=1 Tax=Fulvivirga marina TaxID=2494733 RepID=UPI001EE3139C|nr:peptidase U32 family protein [Fulvivirga marina]
MDYINSKVELLAPAGSFEALAAAIQGGADAVYFGVEQLNMRARSASNFTVEDMQNIVSQCNIHDVRAYLTVNTILYDHDIQLMRRLLRQAKEAGIHAIIASDYAVLQEAKTIGLSVHISTQANVSNIETVEFFSAFADTIVLARELSLKQVAHMSSEIARRKLKGPSGNLIRLEVFAHGALCMAISGKCYLSLHSHFGSANRGACVQNCRKPYIVTDKEDGTEFEIDNEYIMSAKDLCTIDFLDEIVNTGIRIIKIEGRGRSADYVYKATKCYREALDAIEQGKYGGDKIDGWKKELSTVYNRGFWDGYYLGRKLGEWTNQPGSSATQKKIYIAKGTKYYPNIQVGEFLIEAGNIKQGDELMLISPKTGVTSLKAENFKVNGEDSKEAVKGGKLTISLEVKVSKNDKLYKVVKEQNG